MQSTLMRTPPLQYSAIRYPFPQPVLPRSTERRKRRMPATTTLGKGVDHFAASQCGLASNCSHGESTISAQYCTEHSDRANQQLRDVQAVESRLSLRTSTANEFPTVASDHGSSTFKPSSQRIHSAIPVPVHLQCATAHSPTGRASKQLTYRRCVRRLLPRVLQRGFHVTTSRKLRSRTGCVGGSTIWGAARIRGLVKACSAIEGCCHGRSCKSPLCSAATFSSDSVPLTWGIFQLRTALRSWVLTPLASTYTMDGVNLLDWYWEMPPVTRLYFTAAFATTLLCALDITSAFHLYFNYRQIMRGEVC